MWKGGLFVSFLEIRGGYFLNVRNYEEFLRDIG